MVLLSQTLQGIQKHEEHVVASQWQAVTVKLFFLYFSFS